MPSASTPPGHGLAATVSLPIHTRCVRIARAAAPRACTRTCRPGEFDTLPTACSRAPGVAQRSNTSTCPLADAGPLTVGQASADRGAPAEGQDQRFAPGPREVRRQLYGQCGRGACQLRPSGCCALRQFRTGSSCRLPAASVTRSVSKCAPSATSRVSTTRLLRSAGAHATKSVNWHRPARSLTATTVVPSRTASARARPDSLSDAVYSRVRTPDTGLPVSSVPPTNDPVGATSSRIVTSIPRTSSGVPWSNAQVSSAARVRVGRSDC